MLDVGVFLGQVWRVTVGRGLLGRCLGGFSGIGSSIFSFGSIGLWSIRFSCCICLRSFSFCRGFSSWFGHRLCISSRLLLSLGVCLRCLLGLIITLSQRLLVNFFPQRLLIELVLLLGLDWLFFVLNFGSLSQ